MKIVVVSKRTHHHKGYGGMETHNLIMCEKLAELGHEVIVLSPQRDVSYDLLEKSEHGVLYKYIPCVFQKFSSIRKLSPQAWENRLVEVFKEEKNVDIVLSQSSSALALINRKKELGIKVVSISHGTKLSEFDSRVSSLSSLKDYFRLLIDVPHTLRAFFVTQRQFIHGSDAVIAVSSYVKEKLIEETYLLENKVFVVKNGIEFDLKREITKSYNDKIKIMFVGRILRSKGVFILIDALHDLTNIDFELDIVGDGEDLESLKTYVSNSAISEKVTFYGNVPHSKVLEHMATAHIFTAPSTRIEGLPMVIVEAMFSKMAIIASNSGGIKDVVLPELTGELVSKGDVVELREAFSKLLGDTEYMQKLGAGARAFAEENLTSTQMVKNYLNIMEKVLNENS